MIPVKYLEELKTAPVEDVDFVGTFIEVNLHQIDQLRILTGADGIRCSKANIPRWVADRPCTHGLSRHNSTIIWVCI
jgi:hypothetical protein